MLNYFVPVPINRHNFVHVPIPSQHHCSSPHPIPAITVSIPIRARQPKFMFMYFLSKSIGVLYIVEFRSHTNDTVPQHYGIWLLNDSITSRSHTFSYCIKQITDSWEIRQLFYHHVTAVFSHLPLPSPWYYHIVVTIDAELLHNLPHSLTFSGYKRATFSGMMTSQHASYTYNKLSN